jgi:hypothetical protein
MIEFTVQAKDVDECLRQLGQVVLAMISDEDIIREARNRAHKQGLTVAVEMPEAKPAEPKDDDGEPAKRRGRPPKIIADPVAKASMIVESTVADTLTASGGFPAREGNGKEPDKRQQVIDALNAYAASHGGPVAGRQVMKDVCGVTRLVDCTEADYPRLLEALGA